MILPLFPVDPDATVDTVTVPGRATLAVRTLYLPNDFVYILFNVKKPDRDVGYHGDYYGQFAPWDGSEPGIWLDWTRRPDGTPMPVRLHFERIWLEGSSLFASVQWKRDVGRAESLIGGQLLERQPDGSVLPCDPDAVARAHRGFHVLISMQTPVGGSPKGPRKGQVWTRRQCLEWWQGWANLDRTPTQAMLAADMEVVDSETAVTRWRSTGLHWPPNQEELDELEDD